MIRDGDSLQAERGSGDHRRRSGSSSEASGVAGLERTLVIEIAIARGDDLRSPSMRVAPRSVVGKRLGDEPERRSRADHDRSGIAHIPIEKPSELTAVEIPGTVARRLDADHAASPTSGPDHVVVHLDVLHGKHLIGLELDQPHIARIQLIDCFLEIVRDIRPFRDGDRDSPVEHVGREPTDPVFVVLADHLAEDGRAVRLIAPVFRRASLIEDLAVVEVLVVLRPGEFDVDELQPISFSPGHQPGRRTFQTHRGVIEIL